MIEPMKPKMTLQQAEIQDGDIVCFQKSLADSEYVSGKVPAISLGFWPDRPTLSPRAMAVQEAGGYAHAKDFYDYLLNRVDIHLIPSPRMPQNSPYETFSMTLNRKSIYDQWAAKVGEQLKVDPTHIRFWTVSASTNKPKGAVKRTLAQNLSQVLNPQFNSYGMNQRNDALYFEVMDMSLSEVESKKTIRLTLVTEGLTKEVSDPTRFYSPKALKPLQGHIRTPGGQERHHKRSPTRA
jgi:ubiquitin carboxyl-terminal hydrolase 7